MSKAHGKPREIESKKKKANLLDLTEITRLERPNRCGAVIIKLFSLNGRFNDNEAVGNLVLGSLDVRDLKQET